MNIVSLNNSPYFRSNSIVSPMLKKTLEDSSNTKANDGVEVSAASTQDNAEIQKVDKKDKKSKEKKPSLYERGKKFVVRCMQSCNTFTGVTKGIAKGTIPALGTLGAVSLIGKSITDAVDNNKAGIKNVADAVASNGLDIVVPDENLNIGRVVFDSISNIISDIGKAMSGVAKFVEGIPSKKITENLKEFLSPIPKLYSKYLNVLKKNGPKTYRMVATVATLTAAVVFSVKFLKEKFAANEKNADLEHKTNLGHVK